MEKSENQRYMITYKRGQIASEIISLLKGQGIEVYLHNVNNRQIGAMIPQHSLGLVKSVSWLEKIIAD